jgi:hypothetical protein
MLSIAVCWGWANLLRVSLEEGHSFTQFGADNWIFTLIAALGVLLWTAATWQRLRCIGVPEWAVIGCTASLAVLWGYLFYLRMRPLLAFGLLLVVPLTLALASAKAIRRTDTPLDSSEDS